MIKENKKAYIRPCQKVIVLHTKQVFMTGSLTEDPGEGDPGSTHTNAPGMIDDLEYGEDDGPLYRPYKIKW